MRRFLVATAAIALAGPTAAEPVFTPDMDEEMVRSVPRAEEIEAMGVVLDRVVGAVLDMPVGPLVDAIDAADPEGRRHRRYGRHDRVRDVAGQNDPYFEERLRDDIRGVTVGMGVLADQVAVLAPVLRRSLAEVERDVAEAMRDHRERREREEDRRERR